MGNKKSTEPKGGWRHEVLNGQQSRVTCASTATGFSVSVNSYGVSIYVASLSVGMAIEAKEEPKRPSLASRVRGALSRADVKRARFVVARSIRSAALPVAVKLGSPAAVKALARMGVSADGPRSLLALVARIGKDRAAGKLLEAYAAAGLDVNEPWKRADGAWAVYPLHYAAELGNIEAMEALIALGAKLDARDDKGETALHAAAEHGQAAAASLLLRAGIDSRALDNDGRAARDVAQANPEAWETHGGYPTFEAQVERTILSSVIDPAEAPRDEAAPGPAPSRRRPRL